MFWKENKTLYFVYMIYLNILLFSFHVNKYLKLRDTVYSGFITNCLYSLRGNWGFWHFCPKHLLFILLIAMFFERDFDLEIIESYIWSIPTSFSRGDMTNIIHLWHMAMESFIYFIVHIYIYYKYSTYNSSIVYIAISMNYIL